MSSRPSEEIELIFHDNYSSVQINFSPFGRNSFTLSFQRELYDGSNRNVFCSYIIETPDQIARARSFLHRDILENGLVAPINTLSLKKVSNALGDEALKLLEYLKNLQKTLLTDEELMRRYTMSFN